MNEYWILLLPSTSQSGEYSKIINALSKKYNTSRIDAHVTILGPLEAEEDDLITKVKNIANGFNRIEVEVLGINFSNTVSQCVFAQIKMSPQLLALYVELQTNLQPLNKSPFFPHLSLLYGDFSPEEKANIAGQVKVGNMLMLDKLVVFREGPLPHEWTNVAEFDLNSST
jgi:2'-5' RNA ligase